MLNRLFIVVPATTIWLVNPWITCSCLPTNLWTCAEDNMATKQTKPFKEKYMYLNKICILILK